MGSRVKKVASRDNPADSLTKFVPGELFLQHIQWFGYRYPDQWTASDGTACIVQERLRCFAKHLNLAQQQEAFLAQALCASGPGPWGG